MPSIFNSNFLVILIIVLFFSLFTFFKNKNKIQDQKKIENDVLKEIKKFLKKENINHKIPIIKKIKEMSGKEYRSRNVFYLEIKLFNAEKRNFFQTK
jgi:alpha-acetolactate decarboxylase